MKKKPVSMLGGNWSAVRVESDQSIGEDATSTPASSSSHFPTLRESLRGSLPTFGNTAPARTTHAVGRNPPSVTPPPARILPTFGNPPPPAPLVSLPVTTPILPQVVDSRNIEKKVMGIASPPSGLPCQCKPLAPASSSSTLPLTSTANARSNVFFGSILQMEENATRTPASSPSSTFPTLREARRGPLPTFGNAAPVKLDQACEKKETKSLDVNEVISFMYEEEEEEDDTGSFSEDVKTPFPTLREARREPLPTFGNTAPVKLDQACEKKETKSLDVNEVISFMYEEEEEEDDTGSFSEDMRARGVTHEIVKKVTMEWENRVRKRKSAPTRMKLLSMDNEEMCKKEFLIEEDGVTDVCELLMREHSGMERKFVRSLAKESDVWSLLGLMVKESLNPVKINTWINLDNCDVFYAYAQILAVCDKLPQGIVQVEGSYFIMGETLAEYTRVFKMVYASELRALIGEDDGIYEKNIPEHLGVDSLASFLSMGSDASPFVVIRRNDQVFISVRV